MTGYAHTSPRKSRRTDQLERKPGQVLERGARVASVQLQRIDAGLFTERGGGRVYTVEYAHGECGARGRGDEPPGSGDVDLARTVGEDQPDRVGPAPTATSTSRGVPTPQILTNTSRQ